MEINRVEGAIDRYHISVELRFELWTLLSPRQYILHLSTTNPY